MHQLGYALLERGEPNAAEAWLSRAAEGAPEMARYWSTLGRAYALLGKSGDAERAHERARGLEKRRLDEP
jgi:Flp pilus assembly protein TadD